MKKRIALLCAVLLAGLGAARGIAGSFPDGPGGPQIAIINKSSLSDSTVKRDLPVFQKYADQVCEAWHCDGRLYFSDTGLLDSPTDWSITLNDVSDIIGAVGYHSEHKGQIFAYVSVLTARQYLLGWPSVLTHEEGEMLVDPEAEAAENTDCEHTFDGTYFHDTNCTFYIREIADSVQGRSYKLTQGNVTLKVSDWIYRSWFELDSKGPYDAARALGKPLQLYPKDSYMSIYRNGEWQQTDTFGRFGRNWDRFGGWVR